MSFTINSNWRNENLKCYFCGETKSVKYKTTLIVIDSIPVDARDAEREVCICNKCALRMIGTMTRSDMINFIKTHHNIHITHDLFDADEYIYSDIDGLIWDEHGYLFEDWSSVADRWSGANGIRMRTGGKWENGWHIKE